jgi:hypothetical protein
MILTHQFHCMKICLSLVLVFVFTQSYAQAIITTHKEINKFDKAVYIFPVISIPGNAAAAKKINGALQADLLRREAPAPKHSIFEEVWQTTENSYSTLLDIEFEVKVNNKHFLSIAISAEGCGAYCEYFTRYFSFDLRTGNPITVKQLVNAQGQQMIKDSLHIWVILALDTYKDLPPDSVLQQQLKYDPAAKDRLLEMKTLYDNCYWRDATIVLEDIQFDLTTQAIVFTMGRCSNHANRAIDELDDMLFTFPLKTLRPYFTGYAKELLNYEL